ncbi:MAG: HAMP domain-containing histidine kinase [Dehalococcoidia bacterium]|nr:HAMP domain-containing histidine kinase [Dehalococcoidia bacterium]
MNLRTRLTLSHSLIAVLCLAMVAIIASTMLQSYRDRFITARLNDITIPIYIQARSLIQNHASQEEVWARLEEQAENSGVIALLADNQGNVLRQAAPEGYLEIKNIGSLQEKVEESASRVKHGTFETPWGQDFVFAAYPLGQLVASGKPSSTACLVLALPRSGALAIWAGLIRPLMWTGLIALGISILVAFLISRSVYRPIQRITRAAGEIARGRYDQEIAMAGPTEVRELAFAFNSMSREVKLSQQRLRDFVADVSHQLKSPLTSIRGFAQAMLDGTASDSDTRTRAAQVIEDESKRMIRQVDELLELSRIQSGQIQMARELVELKELMEHCQEIFSLRAEERNLSVRTHIESLPPVMGDIDRLEQVFSNLVDNALKHSPPGGEVIISGRKTDAGSAEIAIADSGPGIPPEEAAYVFERFYQAGEVRTGVGLGLAIAREIVLAHSGEIAVSNTPGKGAVFTVTLPPAPSSA